MIVDLALSLLILALVIDKILIRRKVDRLNDDLAEAISLLKETANQVNSHRMIMNEYNKWLTELSDTEAETRNKMHNIYRYYVNYREPKTQEESK